MAFRKNTFLTNLKLLIPAFLLMLVVCAGIGFSIYLESKPERQSGTAAQKSGPSTVTVDGAFAVKLPCTEPDGPQFQDQGGARTTTYTCALVKADGSLDKVYFASSKSYGSTATITPPVDYAFCGTYTDGTTGEVMTSKADQESQVNGRTFRICEYSGDKGTVLYTAKTQSGNSLQTYTVFGPAENMRDMLPRFNEQIKSLQFAR
jgi:hypothetical protein